MSILDSFLYGKLSFLVLLIGYFTLVIGLYYFGYSQGRTKCDREIPSSINGDQYRGGMAGIIIGCIVIAFYHINQMRNY